VAIARERLGQGAMLAVLNVDADSLKKISQLPEAQDDLLFNSSSAANTLRKSDCAGNVLHTIPSRAMLTDALMQFLAKRRWSRIFLLQGNRAEDAAYAEALHQSARKFGLKISYQKQWVEDADLRRNAAAEIPALTQGKDYDIVLVADEARDFGQLHNCNLASLVKLVGPCSALITQPGRQLEVLAKRSHALLRLIPQRLKHLSTPNNSH